MLSARGPSTTRDRADRFGIPWYAYQIARIEKGLQDPVVKVGHVDDKRNFTTSEHGERLRMAVEKCKVGEMYLIGSEVETTCTPSASAWRR